MSSKKITYIKAQTEDAYSFKLISCSNFFITGDTEIKSETSLYFKVSYLKNLTQVIWSNWLAVK